jgi:AcrR family transcriptional regulator
LDAPLYVYGVHIRYQLKWTLSTCCLFQANMPTKTPTASAVKRNTYRHGDLSRALLDEGLALAREGGPAAVVLREATRRAGVVPNAAYRHYGSQHALLQAVRSACLAKLAVRIERELAKIRADDNAAAAARASLRAVGTGYLAFAQAEPGLFRTAFFVPDDTQGQPIPEKAGKSGLNPFGLLGMALDRMVEAGVLPQERRIGAEYLAWSAVHGLAMLLVDGPLQGRMTVAQRKRIGQRLLEMVEKGLA